MHKTVIIVLLRRWSACEVLRDAGLNPNLVYGNGVEGNQSSAPNVGIANRSQHSDFGFAETVQNIFRRRQLENETRMIDVNEQLVEANALLSQARYLEVMQDVARKDATFDTYVEKAAADLNYTRQAYNESVQRVEESKQRVVNMQETVNQIRSTVKNLDAKTKTELHNLQITSLRQ